MIKLEGMKKEYTAHFEKLINGALDQYDLKFKRVRFHGYFTNAIFLIETEDDTKYALKIASPGWRTFDDLNSEAMWLNDLAKGSDIGAVVPIASKEGKYLTISTYEGVPKINCMLMEWLEGKNFWDNINSENIYKMGVMFAKLHNFSESYEPPKGFTTRKMDQIFARNETVELYSEVNRELYLPEQYEIIKSVKERTDKVYEELYSDPQGLMVISHDLHHENIMLDETVKLKPFDFEDTSWGYPVQDIAMAMRDLMEDFPKEFDQYLSDFRKGYESLRAWPEKYDGQMDDFMAGRMLWVANWALINEKEEFEKHITWAISKLAPYVKTGKLRY